jgi:Na+-transporting methylmalonyl-CoA/oxaloacetate decarboxylase beta subunit
MAAHYQRERRLKMSKVRTVDTQCFQVFSVVSKLRVLEVPGAAKLSGVSTAG